MSEKTSKQADQTAEFPSEKDAKFAEKAQQAKKSKKASVKKAPTSESVKQVIADLNDEDLKEVIATNTADLEKQITDLNAKNEELQDKWLRSQAEIQNMHGRHEKERESQAKYAAQKLGTAVLPVVDNLERALAVAVTDESAQQLHKGVAMVLEHLQTALTDNGITEVGKVGEPFDPHFHQAVQTAPADADHPTDTIYQVLQKGYCLKDRTIRPAMVIVAK
ncbi:nucleotide exchange factor GrpE [Lapidilactobacillus luobeiensis]|uniref:nucleotide exchange factor GrpE n=1 Tax=Lapidilactobacillus luobeiensis TaxID=2950371 RepID=UPI0021C440B3|nr:nucleotide exchange factor GrpE [Lapidilactobacillus luobeiensis]